MKFLLIALLAILPISAQAQTVVGRGALLTEIDNNLPSGTGALSAANLRLTFKDVAASFYNTTTDNVNMILPDQTGHAGEILTTNGSVVSWAAGGVGVGTVTSIGLTAPSFLTVSGGPVTNSGTIVLSYSGTPIPTANGGTGTSSPAITPGSGVSVTGTWPNVTIAVTNPVKADRLTAGFNGNGSVITTGARTVFIAPFPFTITGWKIISLQTGSIVIDVRKGTTIASTSSITGSATPALSSASIAQSSTLTGWTTSFAEGDVVDYVVTGTPSGVQTATLILQILK